MDFGWTGDPVSRRRQREALKQALEVPVRWGLIRRRLPDDTKLTVRYASPKALGGRDIQGRLTPPAYTILLNRELADWDVDRATMVALHELLHALDCYAFSTADRVAIYKLFHHGEEPTGFNDPVAHWGWPDFDLFPYGDHGDEPDPRHQWFDGISYRQGIGEAFAEIGQGALLGNERMPYDHEVEPARLRELLEQLGYIE
jgi:hypothetical protein